MSFHHTQAGLAGWGAGARCAPPDALLPCSLALTGCFGGSSENSSSSPSPSNTANHSQYPPLPPPRHRRRRPNRPSPRLGCPPRRERREAKASESSAPAAAKATLCRGSNPTGDTPASARKAEAERASAGERCGHIGRKGYLKTGAEIMALRGTVDCAHALDVLTEYITTPRADDNLTEHQVAKVQDATCYWNPQYAI